MKLGIAGAGRMGLAIINAVNEVAVTAFLNGKIDLMQFFIK